MADKPAGYSLVPGDGGRASGLIRRRTSAEEGDGGGFLDLSLGSIYNSPSSSVADDISFSPVVGRALLPAAALGVPPSVGAAAATATYAPLLAPDVYWILGDGRAVANPVSMLPPLFASDGGSGAVVVPVAVSVHGNATAATADSGTTLLGASPPSAVPPSPNRKAPHGRRGNATGRRRRRSGAANDADADAAPTNGGESAAPPFPWATKTAGTHPTLAELMERGIGSVEGEVRCKRCDAGKTVSYEIRPKFEELSRFIVRNVEAMHDRAPPEWMYPALPDCDKCGQKNSLRPVIAAEKWRINWIFLLLGQTLGLCTLDQLKHFCARTRQHRTGAKDRVLYSTYMELCNQLCPGGPFDMASERKNRIRPFA